MKKADAVAPATLMLWSSLVHRLVGKGLLDKDDLKAIMKFAHSEFELSANTEGVDAEEVLAIIDGLAAKLI